MPNSFGIRKLIEAIQNLSSARDLGSITQIVKITAREIANADGATFVLRDGERCVYVDEDAIGPLWKGQSFPICACISGWSMLNRRSVVVEDITMDSRIPIEAYRTTFVKSLAMFPVRTENPIAAIGIYWSDFKRPTPEQIELLEALANSASTALENIQLYKSLNKNIEQFRVLAESIPQLAWMADETGSIFWYNQRWYDYTGTTLEQMKGWGWKDVHHPKHINRVVEKWTKHLAEGNAWEDTFPLKSAKGEWRWFLSRANPVRDESGNIIRWVGTNTDIQEQREIALDLKLKSNAIENSLAGFDIVNEDGKFIYVNRTYVKMWGYDSADEILGTSPVGHCADPQIPHKIISELKKSGHCDIEFLAKRKDGSTFNVRMLAFLAHDAEGREIYPTTSIDVTKEKRATEELMRAKEEAERANLSKTAFLANMSHEIRTPMTAVLGFTEMLRDRDLSEEDRQNAISRVERSGRTLLKLIDDILDIAKVESGKISVEKVRFSPLELVTEVAALLRLQAEQKGLNLKTRFSRDVPDIAFSDSTRLRQILTNLIGNAIKFTQTGNVVVDVKTENGGLEGRQYLVFDVCDTGMGISESDQKKLFQPFAQADQSITRQFGGTGLGLVLSKRLAQELGGDLNLVESKKGHGSRFVVKIEAGPFEIAVHRKSEAHPYVVEEKNKNSDDLLHAARILVVDDVADNQYLMRQILESAGARVDVAGDGEEAISKALNRNYDVVLMDIQMPHVDGIQATKRLRAKGYGRPILALTAHAMQSEVARSIEAGCDEHLTKPVSRKGLVRAVGKYIGTPSRELSP